MIRNLRAWDLLALFLSLLLPASCLASSPPLCPHVIGWNSEINTWAQGAPWIKVIFANDIAPAKAAGAKVFYRPFTADTVYWENGYLPDQRTGATYADLVWAQISGLALKPEAVSYRNEFDWSNPTKAKRTCAEFVNYKNRLRALGYTGKVIFGSFPPDWVSASTWQDPDLMNAVNASDGVETHEYFDFEVNCCLPNRCFRHRDIALANNTYLQSKDWYIGEFGSDQDHGICSYCGDGLYRAGWRDRGKLTEQQYIDQMTIYRAGCAGQVVAVFVFQQGDQTSWSNFEVVGTSVATYMKTTWVPATGAFGGLVKNASGYGLPGATVTANPGGYSTQILSGAIYHILNVPPGTYTVTASLPGYASQSFPGKTVVSNTSTTVIFTLYPITAISAAKKQANGAIVGLTGIVTARFGSQNTIYIENPDRTCGLMAAWSGPVSVGDKLQLIGTLGTTSDYERRVTASSVTVTGSGTVSPLLMITRSLGGGAVAPYNPATGAGQCAVQAWRWVRLGQEDPVRVLDDIESLNNLGLLVRATGRVTQSSTGFFYMDDGSGWDDFETPIAANGMPPGLKVALGEGVSGPPVGSCVVVTGISSCYRLSAGVFRLLRVSRPQDILVVAY